MDKFYEQLLTTKENAMYKMYNFLMYFSIIFTSFYILVAILFINFYYFVSGMIVSLFIFVFRTLRNNQFKEFEYIFTNGNLQIDVIYNKSKRKTLVDEDVKNFDSFGKVEDIKIPDNADKIYCIPKDYNGEVYVFLLGGRRAVYISPNSEMLKLINLYNVRRRW